MGVEGSAEHGRSYKILGAFSITIGSDDWIRVCASMDPQRSLPQLHTRGLLWERGPRAYLVPEYTLDIMG